MALDAIRIIAVLKKFSCDACLQVLSFFEYCFFSVMSLLTLQHNRSAYYDRPGCSGMGTRGNGVRTPFCTGNSCIFFGNGNWRQAEA